jgi:hypothetical protein
MARATNLLTLLETLRGQEHPLSKAVRQSIEALALNKINNHMLSQTVCGIATGLVGDLEAGLIPDLEIRIRGDVEGDLLAQAHRLLEEHLKDPSAMLIGAVLEDALRQLCRKHAVAEGDSIEAMNEPLRKAGVYGLPQKQQVTAWAAIRNKADHGRFNEYAEAEVRLMHQGVAGFIAGHLGAS